MVYTGGTKGRSRRITPTGLFANRGHIYLEAYCHLDNTSKSFRIDRIMSMEVET
ncbi:WYL domain-containing protein [Candidatus Solincola sp.]|jgi:predicted DNA-binding transcriptional regulator YafY|nr:WYL domain-containing protein [Actinomycetota bacterium]